MADWSFTGEGTRFETTATTATSRGTRITSSATTNTKGTWTQLIAATAFEASGILVMANQVTTAHTVLMDIGVGAATAETLVIRNILMASAGTHSNFYYFPIHVPAGSRIAARMQAATASSTADVTVYLMAQGFLPSSPLSCLMDYGTTESTSRGTSIDPGATANTKGAYSQLTASTAKPMSMMWIALGHQGNTTRSAASILADVAIGAAGSEQIILSNLACAESSAYFTPYCMGPFPVSIPAGTRLAMRAQSTLTTAASRPFDAIIYGAC